MQSLLQMWTGRSSDAATAPGIWSHRLGLGMFILERLIEISSNAIDLPTKWANSKLLYLQRFRPPRHMYLLVDVNYPCVGCARRSAIKHPLHLIANILQLDAGPDEFRQLRVPRGTDL